MHIAPLDPADADRLEQAAEALLLGFATMAPDAWPDLESARAEVHEALAPDRLALGAYDGDGRLLGWIGAQPAYARVWELHPLVVHPQAQRQGVGRRLVAALEAAVRERGALTLYLGTDDEAGLTSLTGVDLYRDTWSHLAGIRNLGGHPFEFYQKCGYAIVGVVPDANGPGRPDSMMAKRL